MESWVGAVVFLVIITVVRTSPLINELEPGKEWPERGSVKQPSDSVEVQDRNSSNVIAPNTDSNYTDSYESNKAVDGDKVDYTGAQIWKVYKDKPRVNAILSRLQRKNLISAWGGSNVTTDILVKPHNLDSVMEVFKSESISFDIIVYNLQKRIDEENPPLDENEIELQNRRGHSMTWKQYHRVKDIYGFLDYLAKTYPSIISVKTIGKSYENRDIKVLRISNGNPSNKAVFIDGGIHAREWISPATVTYFINHIAEKFDGESDDIRNTDWYFLPVVNPDGYEYTHERDRFWRKNRKPGSVIRNCIGTDLNRNFGYKWGGKGASSNACSEIYRGSSAFSEPESKALADFIQSSASKFSAYLTYHSYGQYLLFPWGYDYERPEDFTTLTDVATKMAQAIQSSGGYKYTTGVSSYTLYPAAGGSDDWAKSQGIKYSYTVELSDTGNYGFILPSSYIEPVAKSSLAGLRVLASQIHNT